MKQTSISAYRDITDSGRKATHSERIYAAMLKHGAGTYEQIATYADMQDRQVWKRLSELERDGKIRDSGKTAVLSSGKHGTIWELPNIEVTMNLNPNIVKDFTHASVIDLESDFEQMIENERLLKKIKLAETDNILPMWGTLHESDETSKLFTVSELNESNERVIKFNEANLSIYYPSPIQKIFDKLNVNQPVFSRQEMMDVVSNSIVPLLTKKKQRNVPIPETTTFKRWVQLDLFRDN